MKKLMYTSKDVSLNALELWKISIYFSRVGEHWHSFSKKDDRLYIDFLVKCGAAKHIKSDCYKYDKEGLKNFISELSSFLGFDKKDPEEIVSVKYTTYRTEFHTANGDMYHSETGICLGVYSKSIVKQIPFYKNLHSKVTFLQSDVIDLINACEKSKSVVNKMNLCVEYFRLYKKYYGNTCLGNYPQGSAQTYLDAIKNAEKNGAHWLDGIDGFQVGKTFVSTDDIKNKIGK